MKFLCRLSLFVLASAAFLSPPSSRAATVSISHEKLHQCGHEFVFCNGLQAYSLSEIESGAVQIPVFPILPSEVVVVNDTGHTVNTLELTFSTIQFFSFDLQCVIEQNMKQYLSSCKVAKTTSGFSHNLLSSVSAEFTFDVGQKGDGRKGDGIPNGEYFDITTVGFMPGGFICGHGHNGDDCDGDHPPHHGDDCGGGGSGSGGTGGGTGGSGGGTGGTGGGTGGTGGGTGGTGGGSGGTTGPPQQ